ncbi:hypothetical protein FRX31_024190 [Thalictrum thalictroides]|uniref:Ubiquitin-like domain-containing protein n=1 Tax=Thalictrum thalictroides TaxID=46969 RepID=A0A7J6VM87_THATH|nr:hypothetical protein FRX31_024190 [Thalictrum thalictroides]
MVEIDVEHNDREGDNSPAVITIDSEIENIELISELKAHLALHHPVRIPSNEQILMTAIDGADTLLLDEDRELETIEPNSEYITIFMYRKLTDEFVIVDVVISNSFVDVDRSELKLLITCDSSVSELKDIICNARDIPPGEQILITMGNYMDNNHNLGDYITEMYNQIILCNKAETNGSVPVPVPVIATGDEEEDADADGDMDEDNNQ